MSDTHDVVVIGAGPAGYVCAIRAAQLGMSTVVVESGSYEGGLGGTCLNWGCIPMKALLESAKLAQRMRTDAEQFGVRAKEVEYDYGAAVDRSRGIAKRLTGGVEYLLNKNKVKIVRGRGRIAGPGKVEVASEASSGTEQLLAKNIVIATGSVMQTFPGFELDGTKVIGSRQGLGLAEVPGNVAVVGGGFVGVEFADTFAAFGSQVTVVEALPTLVPTEEPEIGKVLARAFKKRGIKVFTSTRIKSLDRDSMTLTVEKKDGAEAPIPTDILFMAVGRRPVTEDMGLDENGIELDGDFVATDQFMRTAQAGVYAIGDVAGQPMLAHAGSHEGIIAAEHMAGMEPHPMSRHNIPSVGYCHPEVASVGLAEEAAREAGHEVVTGTYPLTSHGRALTAGSNEGLVKIVAGAQFGEVLGVHMIGHNVSELVAEIGLGRDLETTLDEIVQHPHAHPSMSEAVMEAALAALGRAVHI